MKYFSVHYPEEAANSLTGLSNETVFVEEGFSFFAFLAPAIWFAAKRMWIVLAIYIAIEILIFTLAGLQLVPAALFSILNLGLSLVIGFEASNLRRWTLERRRLHERSVVAGRNLEEAERNFYLAVTRDDRHLPSAGRSAL